MPNGRYGLVSDVGRRRTVCLDDWGTPKEQTVGVKRWELWSKDDWQTSFLEANEQARQMAIEDGQTPEWETTAQGWNSAHEAMYAYRGWGVYQPQQQDDGTPYPEDEDDDYNPDT